METTQEQGVSEAPIASLSMDELMGLFIENDLLLGEITETDRALREEIKSRLTTGDAHNYLVKDEMSLQHVVTARRKRGQEKWSYNQKAVENRLNNLLYGDGFLRRSLDARAFNMALDNNEDILLDFEDLVERKRYDDTLAIEGMSELRRARGLP